MDPKIDSDCFHMVLPSMGCPEKSTRITACVTFVDNSLFWGGLTWLISEFLYALHSCSIEKKTCGEHATVTSIIAVTPTVAVWRITTVYCSDLTFFIQRLESLSPTERLRLDILDWLRTLLDVDSF